MVRNVGWRSLMLSKGIIGFGVKEAIIPKKLPANFQCLVGIAQCQGSTPCGVRISDVHGQRTDRKGDIKNR